MDYIISAQNIVKTYGNHTALDGFSLNIPKGSVYGLLGPNGAGKTSFIRILNHINIPDSGVVLFHETPLSRFHLSKIGYMPEERGLYKNMSVREQLSFFGQLKGLSVLEAKKAIDFWLDELNLGDWREKKISDLSKGMAQKVQFIVTVLHKPELIILDEPFSGFDPLNVQYIKEILLKLKSKGTTLILSTHRMESVETLCDYVVLLNQSKKVLDGPINQVREQFKKHQYIIEIRSENIPENTPETLIFSDISDAHIYRYNGYFKSENHANEVLKGLLEQNLLIKKFEEQIPSMNDIFIETVTKHA